MTEAELRVMNVLWETGEATAAEVHRQLARHKLAPTTVQTMLQILETKEYVTHTTAGRAHVYRAAVTRAQMRRAALQKLLTTWFDASPSLLIANLVDEQQLDARELEDLVKASKRRRK
ncbi:MAG TPA: BlaI/MecI/CopY family transcriptional regulator [Thermoanaerobaculia bacterium]